MTKTGSVGTNMGTKRNMIRPVGGQYGGSKAQYGAAVTNMGLLGTDMS